MVGEGPRGRGTAWEPWKSVSQRGEVPWRGKRLDHWHLVELAWKEVGGDVSAAEAACQREARPQVDLSWISCGLPRLLVNGFLSAVVDETEVKWPVLGWCSVARPETMGCGAGVGGTPWWAG